MFIFVINFMQLVENNFLFFRTFTSSNNKNELLEICKELSGYVSKELQEEKLEV